jgi:hypothetical protein
MIPREILQILSFLKFEKEQRNKGILSLASSDDDSIAQRERLTIEIETIEMITNWIMETFSK